MSCSNPAASTLIAATIIAVSLSAPVRAQTSAAEATVKRGQAAPKMLNPQPEVPSKPVPGEGKGATQGPGTMARPNENLNPKALNPQPEVPSKPYKKTTKKKPGAKPPE